MTRLVRETQGIASSFYCTSTKTWHNTPNTFETRQMKFSEHRGQGPDSWSISAPRDQEKEKKTSAWLLQQATAARAASVTNCLFHPNNLAVRLPPFLRLTARRGKSSSVIIQRFIPRYNHRQRRKLECQAKRERAVTREHWDPAATSALPRRARSPLIGTHPQHPVPGLSAGLIYGGGTCWTLIPTSTGLTGARIKRG